MHPISLYEVARYRQADMLREAERVRLAHVASGQRDEPPRRVRRRRLRFAFRPVADC